MNQTEFTVSLEVNREGGDWQRNLVASIDPAGQVWKVDVRITDDAARTVARVGEVSTSVEDLGEIGLAMARVGVARLANELAAPHVAGLCVKDGWQVRSPRATSDPDLASRCLRTDDEPGPRSGAA